MLRFRLAIGFLVVAAAITTGQAPPNAKGKEKPKTTKKSKDAIEGYTKMTIEGFTLIVSNDVEDNEDKKFARKPMDVLELELKMVSTLLPKKTVDLLKKLPVWVEWDEKVNLTNGREGFATAVYMGGNQLNAVTGDIHPGKLRTITILSLASLTAEHQPKTDSGRCVLLHEFAHAVHDQILGRDNAAIKTAYAQAMQRRIYDKDRYICTNDSEFFAEATCAYFNQLPYFPRSRDDLKNHDEVTFKMLESLWSGTTGKKPDPAAKPKGLGSNGSDKFDLAVKLADVKLGGMIQGTPPTEDDLKGKVVVIAAVGRGDAPMLDKLAHLQTELAVYGVKVVILRGNGSDPDKTLLALQERKLDFPFVDTTTVKEPKVEEPKPVPAPHTFVFATDGKCVFRGSGFDALPHARAAVGEMLLSGLGKPEVAKALKPAAAALTSGDPLQTAVNKVAALTSNPDKDTAADAKALLTMLVGPAQEMVNEAQRISKASPLDAFLTAEKIAAAYKGTAVGTKAASLVQTLKPAKLVADELKARTQLEQIQKFETYLLGQAGSFAADEAGFQQRWKPTLDQMRGILELMKKKHAAARATEEAERICKSYGVIAN